MQSPTPDFLSNPNPLLESNRGLSSDLFGPAQASVVGNFRSGAQPALNLPVELSLEDAIAIEESQIRLTDHLQVLQDSEVFHEIIDTSFGAEVGVSQAANIVQDWINGDERPDIIVVADDQLTSVAAFGNDTVFLSQQLLVDSAESPERLDEAVLEEVGHYLDQNLNVKDAPGDEGYIFASLVLGQSLSEIELDQLKQEDDHAFLRTDEGVISVEQSDQRLSHEIQSGETLWTIAARELGSGARWVEIQKADGSNFSEAEADRLPIGQTVYLPPVVPQNVEPSIVAEVPQINSETPPGTSAPEPKISTSSLDSRQSYTVVQDDRLWDLAREHFGDGHRWTELEKADGTNFTQAEADTLQVGQVVYFPSTSESPVMETAPPPHPQTTAPESTAPESTAPESTEGRTSYTVVQNDRLWDLAREHFGDGHRWTELEKADGTNFTQAEADTLQVGQVVYFPNTSESSVTETVPPPEHQSATPDSTDIRKSYTVVQNDRLWDLAREHFGDGHRWKELEKADGTNFTQAEADTLQVGQVVYFPASSSEVVTSNPDISEPEVTLDSLFPQYSGEFTYNNSFSPQMRAFLDMIAFAEGTFRANGYRTQFSFKEFNTFDDHPRDVITANGYSSSAAGRYQFLEATWDGLVSSAGFSDFSPVNQDLAAVQLIKERDGAIVDIEQGDISEAIYKLNRVWASLPGSPYGQPTRALNDLLEFYNGQEALYREGTVTDSPVLEGTGSDDLTVSGGASTQIDGFDATNLMEDIQDYINGYNLTDTFDSNVIQNLTQQINAGFDSASVSEHSEYLGLPAPTPYQNYDHASVDDIQNNDRLKSLMVRDNVGPFTVTGLKPAVEALKRIFIRVKAEEPALYDSLGTVGMLLIRATRPASGGWGNSFSKHSWGTAIDITIGGTNASFEPQAGLLALAPYFREEGFRWGEAFSDAMHFEVSEQLLDFWNHQGYLGTTGKSNPSSPQTPLIDTEVRSRQNRLIELGYDLSQYGADGIFGNETATAIRDFQLEHGLDVTQEFDDATIAALAWKHDDEKIGQNNNLGRLSRGISIRGSVGDPNEYDPSVSSSPGKDDSDLYQFKMSKDQPIKIHLGILSGPEVSISLLDSTLKPIRSADGILSNDIAFKELPAGDYFVRVNSTSGITKYLLSISDEVESHSNPTVEIIDPIIEQGDPTETSHQDCVTTVSSQDMATLLEIQDLAQEATSLWDGSEARALESMTQNTLERLKELEDFSPVNSTEETLVDKVVRYNAILDQVTQTLFSPVSSDIKGIIAYEFVVNGGFDFETSLIPFSHAQSNHAINLTQQDEVMDLAYGYALCNEDPEVMQSLLNNLSETYGGIRNEYITAEYARMGLAIHNWLGEEAGANWSLIASIASDSAGEAITGDVPPLFPLGLGTLTFDDREQFALGNIDIYNDVASELYEFIEFIDNRNPDFVPGNENLVQVGIGTLIEASEESDLKMKQELVLLSSLQMLDHEQRVVIDHRLQDLFKELPWYGDLANAFLNDAPFFTAMEQVKISWDGFSNQFISDDPIPTHEDMLVDYDSIQNEALRELIETYRENAQPYRKLIPDPSGFSLGTEIEEDDYTDFNSRMDWVGNVMGHQGTHPGIISTNRSFLKTTS